MGSIGLGLLAVSLFHNSSVHRLACRVAAMEQIHRSWFYPRLYEKPNESLAKPAEQDSAG
jgi:hypothetical protein